MGNDIERLNNLIMLTDCMENQKETNFNEYLKIVELIFDTNIVNKEEDYKKLNNKIIDKAIKEILNNDRLLKIIKEDTELDISKIQ